MANYLDFLSRKLETTQFSGISADVDYGWLFPHQKDLTKWALKKGRASIFAQTGLGKTRMEIAWAIEVSLFTDGKVLILAPLAVAEQTIEEAKSVGIDITHLRSGIEPVRNIAITNYERLHKVDTSQFVGVVLDESSIIKHENSKTLRILLDTFSHTPYKLCATATPAPNDWTELGTHAEFLGVMLSNEMLAEYFIHDGGDTQKWRLKGHAKEKFWKWVSTWGAMVRSPEDLGHDGSLYELPPLSVVQHTVSSTIEQGELFAIESQTLGDRRKARRDSLDERVEACANIVNASNEIWLVWCDLNAEGDALRNAIPGSVEVRGSDTVEHKERTLIDFSHGKIRVLVSKPSICGFGLNFQVCHNMAFVGVTDSWESYYQAVRRCWRFGQNNPVNVHIFASESEGAVVANLARKEKDAEIMQDNLSRETLESIRQSVKGQLRIRNEYSAVSRIEIPRWIHTGV